MGGRQYLVAAVSSLALTALIAAGIAHAQPSNRWRAQFSGGSQSSGVLTLKLSPIGGEPLVVEIQIPANLSENNVARAVVGALEEQLPQDIYQVERDDGEDVLIRRRRGAANFDLEIVSNTVEHVRINLDRE